MIRPQNTPWRCAIPLDGLWSCRADPQDCGAELGWANGFSDGLPIAIPGSWNEQLAEAGLMNFVGAVWLQRRVLIPPHAAGRAVELHFGSADYCAEVFWNGAPVGRSGPAKLPFTVDLGAGPRPGETGLLVVRVDNRLPEHGPTQRVTREDYQHEGRPKDEYWPAVRFDFFPFGGLNRPVHLCLLPKARLEAMEIRTGWSEAGGWLSVQAQANAALRWRVRLEGEALAGEFASGARAEFTLPGAQPWSPRSPRLYDLAIELLDADGAVCDRVERRIGFRSVAIEGLRLLLNGEPVTLQGFGKHEDSPIAGAGVNLAYLVKDFQLLSWVGANSVRTSHYPYDESFLDLADETGLLVIPEVFSINLDFRRAGPQELQAHQEAVAALIARDGWRASVIAWSLANEPGYLGEREYAEASRPYWQALFAAARAADPTRPLTGANVQYAGLDDPLFEESDFLSINRYFGWYTEPGQLDRAGARLRETLDILSARHGKPVFVSEFGADAVAGLHATTDQMWTEEYQADFIAKYWEVMTRHPACIGGHVWNFADFRTAQHGRRVVFNHKGVFTRTRDPKRAAFVLRQLWRGGA
jgi:beta-glucuronidase